MKTLIFLLLVLFATPSFGAELLVQAKDSPFEDGAKKGDIIVVRPDGWIWGKEECLPNYVVVKLQGVPVEEASKYEEPLTEQVAKEEPVVEGMAKGRAEPMGMSALEGESLSEAPPEPEMETKIIRARKYSIPREDVDALIATGTSVKPVLSKDVASYPVVEKDLVAEKAMIAEAYVEEVK